MSSYTSSGGRILLAATSIANGSKWLAWQSGKMIINTHRAIEREIAENKHRVEEAAQHRKRVALAAHSQLVDMCTQILTQIEEGELNSSVAQFTDLAQIKIELTQIKQGSIPEDVALIESLNALGFSKLQKITQAQQQIANLTISSAEGLYHGLSVADLMDDLQVAFSAAQYQATAGKDIQAPDPMALERAKLNTQLIDAAGKIMSALAYVQQLTNTYGLSAANSAWFHSCFNGVDTQIEHLCQPTTTNEEIKKGVKRLNEMLVQYDMVIPSIETDLEKLDALYQVYIDAAKALGEPIADIKSFKSAAALEEKLTWIKGRVEKAQKCAEIHKKLGPSAYLCYAWDQELKSLGYAVHTRAEITNLINHNPQHAKIGDKSLPFYCWSADDLTQMYSVADQCDLQVIVHSDGTVSMQTIANNGKNKQTEIVQAAHCKRLQQLYERLAKNWFIYYDYQEITSPDIIMTVEEWKASKANPWKSERRTDNLIAEQRTNAAKERYMAK